jgi:ABC-type bacteriocin/lantibiotic exporter with double-glycine peptidase domain
MKEMPILTPLQRFIRLLNVERSELYSIYSFAIFNGLINLTIPLGIQSIINLIGGGIVSSSWLILVLVVIVGVALSGVLQVYQLSVNENLQQKIFSKSAFEFAFRIPRLKTETIEKYYIPEMVMRFFETVTIQKGLSKILIDFSSASLQVLFGLILLSIYHPSFIIYSGLFIGIVVLLIKLTGNKGLQSALKESNYKYEVTNWLVDIARNMESYKMAGNTNLPMDRTDELLSKYLDARKTHFKILKFQYSNLIAFKVLVTAGLLLIGGLLVIDQQMNIGQFVASEIIIILLLSSVEKLIFSMETIYDVLAAVEKLGGVNDLELENQGGREINFENVEAIDIELKNFNYRFMYESDYVLKNINLEIKAGDKVCLAGYNGSGKSMLMHVIAGLYYDYEGSISFNTFPLSNIKLDYLRSKIGSSFAKEDIIQGTILDNICMGRKISFEEVLKISEIIGLHEYIQSLEKGYDTFLHPEGVRLPKSRILKIKLARCLVGNPKLILIEDHFNLLEKKYKEQLLDFILNNKKWTVVIVSNDIEIANKLDYVVALNEGSILDIGTVIEMSEKEWFKTIIKS